MRPEESTGQRLARFRRTRGLTQVQLADELGVTQSFVSQFERDDVRLPGDTIGKLARILRVTSDEILGLKPPKADGLPKTRRIARRLQQIEQLPSGDQQAILRVLDAVLAGRLSESASGSAHARG